MHRWTQRYRELLDGGLEDGEVLVDANRALLVAVGKVDFERARGTDEGAAARRARPHRGPRALAAARGHNVELPARFFVLGVTDRRLVVWRATRALARPLEPVTSIPAATVASVRAGRRFGPSRLHVVLMDGTHLQLRPLGRGRLDHLADAFADLRASQSTGEH